MRELVEVVDRVPAFVAKIIDQLLEDTIGRRPPEVVARGMQTKDVE